ncbi:type II toxin-antitoxin system HipA family toxin YjjJ [Azospira inquinata]|uniref:Type II toxin-antitoxin system HipA family toxin YjjJ n=1 Tax=Azospira inquinata TaxID=2785627 RepID=A0A975SK63_9RHOO|nr:type II toxin-antitoxin system HipA family toxin YjjJ [Azospira inquinata]QWT46850.1 type II toxin-antitoxin system HipA family toxin YjjJ [Azospira inquinata]QWT47827.1 type II toxin-antitoxin system HipA family toxin YjjJ [Azospira inquinata]
MAKHTERLAFLLGQGPLSPREIQEKLGLSQPTLSRAVQALGPEIIRIGRGRSIQYGLRDSGRGLGEIPVYRVGEGGTLEDLGRLLPVRPAGFVLIQPDGKTSHSDSLPWWLDDMRPQGYLGRLYVARQWEHLGLPAQLKDWDDTHVLRALLQDGADCIGNLLLGEGARATFLADLPGPAIREEDLPEAYPRLAEAAARGALPGSSAGGEQPKFIAYVQGESGPRHVLVKFTLPAANPVSQRWRDLLLAEHLALQALNQAGIPAVSSRLLDWGNQRFLEGERFDRIGTLGRRGVFSLGTVDAQFTGVGRGGWTVICQALARAGILSQEGVGEAARLQAFGHLIGNTDMHPGNLSLIAAEAPPYALAPAYDMLPMAFAPTAGGDLPQTLASAPLPPAIGAEAWRRALGVARDYLARLREESGFSAAFRPCIGALETHLAAMAEQISRLA